MRKLALIALLPLIVLAACKKPAGADRAAAPSEAVAVRAMGEAPLKPAAPPAPGGAAVQAAAPMLAYDYSVGLSLPAANIRRLMARHEQACAAAGPQLCQVIESTLSKERGETSAELRLRAEPHWLARFRAGLEQDAKGAGGALVSSRVTSEDLTRSIVDTEAMLRAKTTLRDRLQQLLAQHPGKMSDLLEIEKQLADTQGEIDAGQSELAVMRGRVDMSQLKLSYDSSGPLVTGGAAQPLAAALHDFGAVVMRGAAIIVYVTAFLIPFAVIVVPLAWLWLRRRARKKAEKAAA